MVPRNFAGAWDAQSPITARARGDAVGITTSSRLARICGLFPIRRDEALLQCRPFINSMLLLFYCSADMVTICGS